MRPTLARGGMCAALGIRHRAAGTALACQTGCIFLLEIQKIACKLHAITRGFSILHRAMVFVILRKPMKTNSFSMIFIEKPSFTMLPVRSPLPLHVRLGDPWGTLKFDKFPLNPLGALLGLHFFIS